MAFGFIIGLILLFWLISFGVSALITHFAVLPIADAIWGIDLPFWPTLIVLWFISGLFSSITVKR